MEMASTNCSLWIISPPKAPKDQCFPHLPLYGLLAEKPYMPYICICISIAFKYLLYSIDTQHKSMIYNF